MTGVRFYHTPRTPLDHALQKMLGRTLGRGQRAVVRAGSEARVEALSARLWTYHDRSFLPHGTVKDGRAERQPVWLTVADDENPNHLPINDTNATTTTTAAPFPTIPSAPQPTAANSDYTPLIDGVAYAPVGQGRYRRHEH